MLKRTFFAVILAFPLLVSTSMADVVFYPQLKHQKFKEKPAIVLCAFGTSTKAQVTFDMFDRKVRENFPGYEIRWAFTSDIIRTKMNRIYEKKGVKKRLYSLQEVLSSLQAEGYTKVVVQPLHIFPGIEYQKVLEICKHFPGLKIAVGEPLFYRWENVKEVLEEVSREFLPPKEGINILVAHGTDVTVNDANIAYIGIAKLVKGLYPNVILGTIEGVPDAQSTLKEAIDYPAKRVRFIPFMFVAGDHIMNDVMGKGEEEKSWREVVEEAGKKVDCVTVKIGGKTYYKGLGMYEKVSKIFMKQIKRCLELLEVF